MSTIRLTYISEIKNGKLQPNVTRRLLNDFRQWEGKKVLLSVEKLRSKRSIKQNAYLHLAFTIIKEGLNDLGNDFSVLEIKELLKYKFLLTEVFSEKTGEIFGQRIRGTSELSKEELCDFI